ncbi:MAG: serine protease [Chloroflexi bacterium]|nr:serine protease [Chloroflexota bacterium]
MFVDAIEKAAAFTRSIHMISRNYGSEAVQPHAATLFFVNADGWALTCAHVARVFRSSEQLKAKYDSFKHELAEMRKLGAAGQTQGELEANFEYSEGVQVELHVRFMGCVLGPLTVDIHPHPTADIALLKFNSFDRLLVDSFPIFPKNTSSLRQGLSLCRLGFPFPEFNNFSYDKEQDLIHWTETGRTASPRFPLDGMVTRHMLDSSGEISGFEMSTPGLRGQSGGPAFGADGKVWGMQSATRHLDLDFDVDVEVLRQGVPQRVRESAFLHVGQCIHVDALKAFMVEKNVAFQEG